MGRLFKGVKEQRDELIFKILAEGHGSNIKEIKEMARQLASNSLFVASKSEDVVYQYIYRVIRRQKQNGIIQKLTLKPKTCQSQSRFEQIVNGVSLRLPVGASDQIARLLRVLRAEWSLLEQEALKAKQLEVTVREFEHHRCPDASGELLEENRRLKEQIAFLERRVEALSRLTTPRQLNDKHLVVSS